MSSESSDLKKPRSAGNELLGYPGTYQRTHGQLTLLEYAVRYQTADGKKVEIRLGNIVEVSPFDGQDAQVGIIPSVAIVSQAGTGKQQNFGFTSNSARQERDAWLKKLREQIKNVVQKQNESISNSL